MRSDERSAADGACPDDELLAGMIENRIDEITRAALERHAAACSACADVVAAVLAAAHDRSLAPAARPPATAPTAERSLVASRGHRPRRPPGRRGLAIAAGLALVATAALGYVGGVLLLDRAASALARRAGDLLGQPVAIGRVAVRVDSDLRALALQLADVRVGIGSLTPSSAAGVELVIAIAPLWRGALAVEHVRLIRPVLYLGEQPPALAESERKQETRHLRLGTRAPFALLGGSRFEIAGGTVVVGLPDGSSLTVTQVSATSAPIDEGVRIALTGTLADGSVAVDATLAADATGTFTLTVDGHDLALAALPYARGRARGIADVRLTATGSTRAPRLAGTVAVRGGHALGWNPLPALLEPAAAATLAGLVPALAGGGLPFEELHVTIAAHRGTWRIRRAHVTSAGLAATGRLRLTASRGVDGAAAVRLPPDLAAPLLTAAPSLAVRRAADGSITLPYSIAGTIDTPQFTPRF